MNLHGAKCVVTGAAGFIGSHLVERLVAEGAQVRGMVRYSSHGGHGWLEQSDIQDQIDVRLGDVRDPGFVRECCRGVDYVFHLAALISIPHSYAAPQSFVETNVNGTLNVLEAVRGTSIQRVVQTSTSEVYGTPETVPIRETHPLQAQSPYAASKVGADQLALACGASFDIPVTVLRPFNTFGPRQSTRAVLMTILAQLLAGVKEVELGRLDTSRDLTFVADTVDGFVRAATAPVAGRTIQLGTGRMVSIGELFETCRDVLGVDAKVVQKQERMRPGASEVERLLSDPSLAGALLGWSPTTPLEEGIRKTADWLREHLAQYEATRLHL